MVRDKTFREDLFYRLRGATLRVPPLRERAADVPAMVKAFLQEATAGRRGRPLVVAPEATRALALYSWPGNVREVHRWTVFCDERVDLADLAPEIRLAASGPASARGGAPSVRGAASSAPAIRALADVVRDAERVAIDAALAAHKGNILRTARALGIERNTLKRKLRAR
jgi:DNA-binding NtrC family response regulator